MESKGLLSLWTDHVSVGPEEQTRFQDLLKSPCPARFIGLADLKEGQDTVENRLKSRALINFQRRMQRVLQKDMIGFYPQEGLLPGNLVTGLIGTYGGRNVVLDFSEGGKPEFLLKGWALRWELTTLSAITNNPKFMVLFIGAGSQMRPSEMLCSVKPNYKVVDILAEPVAIESPACSSCVFSAGCIDRMPRQGLGSPPPAIPNKGSRSGFHQISEKAIPALIKSLLASSGKGRSVGYHPSSIGREIEEYEPCLRVFYYQAAPSPGEAAKSPFPDRMQLVFAMGHAWHDVLQAVIKEATPEAEIELKVRSGRMVGHCDVKYPDLTVDIKTKARPGSQIKGYVGQVHCYCYANGTSKGAFLTAYKSTGMLTLEEFELQDEIMERLEFSLKTTDQYIDDGILPPHFQGAEPQHSRCTSCHFKENCWDES